MSAKLAKLTLIAAAASLQWPIAAEAQHAVTLSDGSTWTCGDPYRHGQTGAQYICQSASTGEMYQWPFPLSDQQLKAERAAVALETKQAACVCSRQLYDGDPSGTRIPCTGAFSPYVLRGRKTDPCAAAWEKAK